MVDKLNHFIKNNEIPNLLLYGTIFKDQIIDEFVNKIYDEIECKTKVLKINCAESNQGGIKFIRDELKFFGKSITSSKKHKSIILYNADNLTHDAQSALRRCIEIYSHTTRFIFVVDKKQCLLNPLLSRFCSVHLGDLELSRDYFKLYNINTIIKNEDNLISLTNELYNKGFHIFNLMTHFEKNSKIDDKYKYKLLCFIDVIRLEIFNERIVMYIFLYYYRTRCNIQLKNIIIN